MLDKLDAIIDEYNTIFKAKDPILLQEFLVIKSTPRQVIAMESRLNKRLVKISDTLINKLIDDYGYDATALRPDIVAAYTDVLPKTYMYGARSVLDKVPHTKFEANLLKEEKLAKLFDDKIFRASETTMERLTGDIVPKIKNGIREGMSYDKTAAELRPEFKEMSDWQLKRISRTEVHSSYNESKLETMIRAESVEGKQWVASGLDNMRDTHGEADGQIVLVDEPFIVDGEELMYPGDPNGSPENVINCACTMIPVLRKREED